MLDNDENELNDHGISIDETTGVVYTDSAAQAASIKIKAELTDNHEIFAVSEAIPTYKMTASNIIISGPDYLQLTDNDVSETYKAAVFDQNGTEMPQEEISGWSSDSSENITIIDGVLTAQSGMNDAIVTVTVTAGHCRGRTGR